MHQRFCLLIRRKPLLQFMTAVNVLVAITSIAQSARAQQGATAADVFQSAGSGTQSYGRNYFDGHRYPTGTVPIEPPKPKPKDDSPLARSFRAHLDRMDAMKAKLQGDHMIALGDFVCSRENWCLEADGALDDYQHLTELPDRVGIYANSFHFDTSRRYNDYDYYFQRGPEIDDEFVSDIIEPFFFSDARQHTATDIARLSRLCRHTAHRASQNKQDYLFRLSMWSTFYFCQELKLTREASEILASCSDILAKGSNLRASQLVLRLRAGLAEQSKDYKSAVALREQHLKNAKAIYGVESEQYACSWIDMAQLYLQLENPGQFDRCWRSAVDSVVQLKKQSKEGPDTLGGPLTARFERLASSALDHRLVQAADSIMRCDVRLAANIGPKAAEFVSIQHLLNYYEDTERFSDEEEFLSYAIDQYKEKFGANDGLFYAPTLCLLADAYASAAAHHPLPAKAAELRSRASQVLRKAAVCLANAYGVGSELYTSILERHVRDLPDDEAAVLRKTFEKRQAPRLADDLAEDDSGADQMAATAADVFQSYGAAAPPRQARHVKASVKRRQVKASSSAKPGQLCTYWGLIPAYGHRAAAQSVKREQWMALQDSHRQVDWFAPYGAISKPEITCDDVFQGVYVSSPIEPVCPPNQDVFHGL